MPYRAQSEVEAANLALGEIGEPPIGNLSDPSARARAVKLWFGTVRDDLLRAHDWGFCSAWITPARSPVAATGNYVNRFVLPDDCLKVRDVQNSSANSTFIDRSEWDIEAAAVGPIDPPPSAMILVATATSINVNYTRRVTQVRLWDPSFVTAFVKALAAAIAPAIARNLSAAAQKAAESGETLQRAVRTDSREISPRHVSRESSWVRSRALGSAHPWRRWQ